MTAMTMISSTTPLESAPAGMLLILPARDCTSLSVIAATRSFALAGSRPRASSWPATSLRLMKLNSALLPAVVTARQMLFHLRSQGSVRTTDSTAGTCVAVRGGDELERAQAQGRNLRAWPVPARLRDRGTGARRDRRHHLQGHLPRRLGRACFRAQPVGGRSLARLADLDRGAGVVFARLGLAPVP